MPPAEPVVRLDSFDAERGPRSFRFAGHVATLQARALAEVVPTLAEVERATSQGLHAVGFVAYEAAPALDPALTTRPPDPELPLVWFALFRERTEPAELEPAPGSFALGEWSADTEEPAYDAAFERIHGLLAAGDTYQVNYTFRLRAPFSGDPLALYDRLCRAQRSSFCAYLDLGSRAIVSASPELFFQRTADLLTLRPMKGTRPRGRWAAEDASLEAELVSSPKERAENLMIVDLLRNDAGRIAVPGSVRVDRMFEVEHYDTVHQMTSTIRAQLRPEVGLVDLMRAVFPCGSVTGAPKVRTMEIIAAAERSPRGVYCGAIGFASPGEAVFSVGIRTVVVDRDAGRAELGVGSGVTWDSTAAQEYAECLGKASFARSPASDFELLETLRYEPGVGFLLLDGHLLRLEESARRFGFRYLRAPLIDALHRTVDRPDRRPLRVRLILGRDGSSRVTAHEIVDEPPVVRVAISADPIDSRDALRFHKTTRREPYQQRLAEHPGCDDVLLLNERGELTESTIANLVVSIGGRLLTPPLECGLLPGVLRAELLRRGEIVEQPLMPSDLPRAESLWLISSVRRWRRAVLPQAALA
jgi:para-aminobenzoate synthetase / 4-amino-4-deoxychorismate lyase